MTGSSPYRTHNGSRNIDLGWAQAEQNARGLWECLLLSGADVSDFAYETNTEEGREAGFREFALRGSVGEVVDAVRQLRADYDEACSDLGDESATNSRDD